MTVLITRPEIDAQHTADFLTAHGLYPHIDSLIKIEPHTDGVLTDCTAIHHIIFTSKNGVRAFCAQSNHRHMTAWCVGEKTAQCALDNGFSAVHSADGDKHDLVNLILTALPATEMMRVYRADLTSDDIASALTKAEYTITPAPLYRTHGRCDFNDETIAALTNNTITDAVFYSPHSAQITAQAFEQSNTRDACRGITAWCISENTAKALSNFPFREVIIAPTPDENALLTPLIARKTNNG